MPCWYHAAKYNRDNVYRAQHVTTLMLETANRTQGLVDINPLHTNGHSEVKTINHTCINTIPMQRTLTLAIHALNAVHAASSIENVYAPFHISPQQCPVAPAQQRAWLAVAAGRS